MMKATIYISRAVSEFSLDQLSALSAQAAVHNAGVGITGYLWYHRGQFLQYIEGDEIVLDQLMAKISHDERHELLCQHSTMALDAPKFPNWSMNYFQANQTADINIERVLSDQMLFLESASIKDPKMVAMVWRLTDALTDRG